jgi:hypothetical protein
MSNVHDAMAIRPSFSMIYAITRKVAQVLLYPDYRRKPLLEIKELFKSGATNV